jgi:hypothetical protein
MVSSNASQWKSINANVAICALYILHTPSIPTEKIVLNKV